MIRKQILIIQWKNKYHSTGFEEHYWICITMHFTRRREGRNKWAKVGNFINTN